MGAKFTMVSLGLFNVIWIAAALRCNDYQCNNENCMGRGKTCETDTGSCKTQKSVSSSTTAVMYYCFDMSGIECTSHAQNNSGTIVSNECCHTDMCNDDRQPQFEEGQDYCYSASCDSEGCLEGMIKYVDTENIGAFCKADTNGCQTTKQTYKRNGIVNTQEATGCVSYTCSPTKQATSDLEMSLSCCSGHLCNKDVSQDNKAESQKKYCHVFSCRTYSAAAPCPSLTEAIRLGLTRVCEMNPKTGCMYHKQTTRNMSFIASDCVGMCMSSGSRDSESIIRCCSEDRCNPESSMDDQLSVASDVDRCGVIILLTSVAFNICFFRII